MSKLAGKVAFVTGAASGLGRACGQLFAAEGAAVVFSDMNLAGAQEAAAEVVAQGGQASAEQVDVTDEHNIEHAIAAAVARFGRLDVLLTCAGIGDSARIEELDGAAFNRTMQVNVTGTYLCAKYAWPHLGLRGGSIIGLGSVAGIIGTSGFASYGASKAAVIHLMKILAMEGARKHIRANAICPSWIWTPMVEKAMQRLLPDSSPDQVQKYLARQAPLGRMGVPEDVTRAALYLASDDSSFMTGQALVLDGGTSLGPRGV